MLSRWAHLPVAAQCLAICAELLPPVELPMLAAHALVDGRDSSALRELAGLPRRSDETEIRELYVQALHELGIPLPDEETAGRWLLASLAFGLARTRRTTPPRTPPGPPGPRPSPQVSHHLNDPHGPADTPPPSEADQALLVSRGARGTAVR